MSDDRTDIVDYICKRFAQEDDLLCDVLEQQRSAGGPMMNVGPDQGKFLNLLVKLHKPKNILEVGSYFGYSSIWLGRAARVVGAHLYCAEISEKQCEIIKDNLMKAGLHECSTVLQGSGIDIMDKFINEKKTFEMIFIDADKSNYPNYVDLAAKLLSKGGLLLVDNCIWHGDVLNTINPDSNTKAIQESNDKLSQHPDFDSLIVTIQDGLAFAVKK
jgi:caffeoyl-CoA O-methyltransferase